MARLCVDNSPNEHPFVLFCDRFEIKKGHVVTITCPNAERNIFVRLREMFDAYPDSYPFEYSILSGYQEPYKTGVFAFLGKVWKLSASHQRPRHVGLEFVLEIEVERSNV